MQPSASDSTNFFWHCQIAAKLFDELPDSTVRNAYVLRAVRMASNCHIGAKGVRYASPAALAVAGSGLEWKNKGLVKEHVVPVSVIAGFVREALKRDPQRGTAEGLSDLGISKYPRSVVDLFRQHPRAWQVAREVRKWTSMAWITENENRLFGDKELHGGKTITKCMPAGWTPGDNHFDRYVKCEIKLICLEPLARLPVVSIEQGQTQCERHGQIT